MAASRNFLEFVVSVSTDALKVSIKDAGAQINAFAGKAKADLERLPKAFDTMVGKKTHPAIQAVGVKVKAFSTAAVSDIRIVGQAFLDAAGAGIDGFGNALRGLGGIAAGAIGAMTGVAAVFERGNKAAFNLESSLAAANREFGNLGGQKEWEAAIDRLSDKLKVYSDTDLKAAASRTVDMTKRLGMSAEQMERVIELTGDLSAGKTGLEEGVERVTAALRGEAEASEYLGLTLNENYVKSWYQANKAHKKAWKDLTDLEKAQVRYQVLLEQATPMQGRAAASANTFSGALKLMRKELENAITRNKSVVGAMNALADALRQNTPAISAFVSWVVTGIAKAVELAVKWRDVIKWAGIAIATMMGLSVVVSVVRNVVLAVQGINAALALIQTTQAAQGLASMAAAANTANYAALGLKGTLGALAGLLFAWEFGQWVGGWLNSFATVQIAAQGFFAAIHEGWLRIKLLWAKLFGSQEEEAALRQQIAMVRQNFDEAVADIKAKAGESEKVRIEAEERVGEAVKNNLDTVEQITDEKLKAMSARYQQYADEVKRLQDEIANKERSLAEQLRSMSRTGMSDFGAWKDREKEAREYEKASKDAAKAGNFELAAEMAAKAKDAYADLNQEVKSTAGEELKRYQAQAAYMKSGAISGWNKGSYQEYLQMQEKIKAMQAKVQAEGAGAEVTVVSQQEGLKRAQDGVKQAGELEISMLKEKMDAATAAAHELDKLADGKIGEKFAEDAALMGESWKTAFVEMRAKATEELDVVKDRIEKLVSEDRTVWINVRERVAGPEESDSKPVQKKDGGLVARLAAGGFLPGYGGGDRIPALLEAGEYVIRKEAVKRLGLARLNLLNSLRLPRFKDGGPVSTPQAPARVVELRFKGGSLNGGENDVAAMLRLLEEEGLRA